MQQDILDLTVAVEQLKTAMQFSVQREQSEREKLALQLQVEMLKFERRLPPTTPLED